MKIAQCVCGACASASWSCSYCIAAFTTHLGELFFCLEMKTTQRFRRIIALEHKTYVCFILLSECVFVLFLLLRILSLIKIFVYKKNEIEKLLEERREKEKESE